MRVGSRGTKPEVPGSDAAGAVAGWPAGGSSATRWFQVRAVPLLFELDRLRS